MKNNFFPYLQWILKSTTTKPEIPKHSSYLTNRWLSMASKSIANIVNLTTNRWCIKNNSFEEDDISKFYRVLIPRYGKKIDYIKKSPREDEDDIENIERYSEIMELSKKEIEQYQKMLDELNLSSK